MFDRIMTSLHAVGSHLLHSTNFPPTCIPAAHYNNFQLETPQIQYCMCTIYCLPEHSSFVLYKPCIGWGICDSCHAQEHEITNALYILPAGLQQKKRTDDVALACCVNVAMSVKVVTLRAWPAD